MKAETLIALVLVGLGLYLWLGRSTAGSQSLATKSVGAFTDADWRRVFNALPRELTYKERRAIEAARLTAREGITQGAITGTSILPGWGTLAGVAGGYIASELI